MRKVRRLLFGVAAAALIAAPAGLGAQAISGPASAVESTFADAVAKEAAVRKALAAPSPPDTLLKAVRTVIADYEGVIRRYPSSGYCDDALWRAARLASDAFEALADPREQATAIRLLQSLVAQYPSSKYAKQAPAEIASLTATTGALPAPVPAAPPPQSKVPASPASFGKLATIKDVRRANIGEIVRVVIELDMEVAFHDERLENPDRVFVDLRGTRTVASLKDQTIRFDGDLEIVRQVRIGRHPDNTTRVVLETSGVSSYSVYPLYSPYRLVIDCLRATPAAPAAAAAPSPPRPVTSLAANVPAPLPARRVEGLAAATPSVSPAATAALAEAAALDSVSAGTLPAAAIAPTADLAAKPASGPLGAPSKNLDGGFSIARQLGLGVSRIVIDPGHGGHDSGAKGSGTTEAELVLDVALRLERLLAKVPGVNVVLTRRSDQYLTLQERTAIANRENADLFLSIHANASSNVQAQGIETYFLDFATNLTASAIAARENAAFGQSMGELPDVVKAIALNSKLDESRDFATFVQREMMAKLRPVNRSVRDLGVKQAPFAVLIGAAMPSVLAEISFMTNAQEARLLKTPAYRQKIAEALFDAISGYQTSLKTNLVTARETTR